MRNSQKHLSKVRTDYFWTYQPNCAACWKCIDACSNQVIGKVNFLWHKHIIIRNGEKCTGCKKCIKTCPGGVFLEQTNEMKNVSI